MTLSEFRTRFSEFADVTAYPDAYLTALLDEAELWISTDYFGSLYDVAHGYLTAHLMMSTASGAGGGGPIQSVSAGSASISYAVPSVSSADYGSTAYGILYRDLERRIGPTVVAF